MISAILFAAAMDILANCRAMLPAEPVTMKGEIVLRNRRGIPSGEYGYTLRSDRTKTPAKLSLEPETKTVVADGEDICYVNVSLRDAEGLVVPRTCNPVRFSVEGPGVIIATDNGDETDFDDFRKPSRRIFNGWAQALVRAVPGRSGKITVTVESDGLPASKAVITAVAE